MVSEDWQHINRFITNKERSNQLNLTAVEEVLKQYPAFHSAHLIRAYLLHNNKSAFDSALPFIATNVRDRAQLHDLLHQKVPIQWVEGKVALVRPPLATDVASENLSEKHPKAEVAEDVKEEIAETFDDTREQDELAAEKLEEIANDVTVDAEKTIDVSVEEPIAEENLSYIDWLKQKNVGQANTKQIIARETEGILFDATAANEAAMIQEMNRTSGDQLDRFIYDQINRKKQVKTAKTMTKNNTPKQKHTMVTETLAEIFALQHKYDEAIEIYEALVLKYPQKSSYFARQIENLKKNL